MDKILNARQLEAITHGDGPLLIIAGAGTGKTTVITERVKWLITKELAKPQEILALTFTDKAAMEMEERTDQIMPYGYNHIWIKTFHGFCETILHSEALHIGLVPNFKLMSEASSVQLFRKNLFNFSLDYFRPLGNPNKFISALLQHISRLKDEDIAPNMYKNSEHPELVSLYKEWEELKQKEGVMDFGDLISETLRLFRTRPKILSKYKQKFKYILVDEFQDTNYAQNLLIRLLINDQHNLTVVADDDQAIYQWRGAAVGNVMQFRQNFSESKLVVLTQNYRSTQEILDRSHDLIRHNDPDRLEVQEKIDKKLMSERKIQGEKIEFLYAQDNYLEADLVVKKIKAINNPEDIAILVRANAHAEPFMRALEHEGVAYQFLGPDKLFFRPEIKDLIALLKVIDNPQDDVSLYRMLTMDFWGIAQTKIAELIQTAKKQNISLWKVCDLESITALINQSIEASKKNTASEVLYGFMEQSGMIKTMFDEQPNIIKFFDKLRIFESEKDDKSVAAAVEWLDLAIELGESPLATVDSDWRQNKAVNILTIHSAKGLEFPVVFMVNLVVDRFPSRNRSDALPVPEELVKEIIPSGDVHEQEERRLFYVGMTRAKDHLFFSAAKFYGDGKREKKISPFVFETLGEINTEPQTARHSLNYKSNASSKTENLKLKVDYLTYSHIQTFLECPAHYKAKYMLHLPENPTASLSFGISMHNTLRDFATDPTQDILQLLKRNWIANGYLNKQHQEEFFTKGESYLRNFKLDGQTESLEQSFKVKLTDNLTIGGRIDRIDKLEDGSLEIIDYKTGANVPEQDAVDKNLQLSFYALAYPEAKLSLYYFAEQKKITTKRSAEQLEAAKRDIIAYAQKISESDFTCTGRNCLTCSYKMLCDVKTTV